MFLAAYMCGLLLQGCEKVDLTPKEDENAIKTVVPHATGKGTQIAPYTVEDFLAGGNVSSGYCWVVGYAVGSTYRTMSNAEFMAETSNMSNILLSNDSTCTSVNACIPVELPNAAIQKLLSLHYNRNHFHHCVMVYGQVGRYFSQGGLRNTQNGYWLPGFDLSQIKNTPTEWQEWNADF